MTTYPLPLRLKRLRKTSYSRYMLQETHLHLDQFIMPLFIAEGLTHKREIPSMPGQYQLSLESLPAEIEEISKLGLKAVLLFGIPSKKTSSGSSALGENGVIQQAIRIIRYHNPELVIITDLCFCEYTDHGHCGVLIDNCIDNDKTLDLLCHQAISHAEAGANWVAPSGMVDGMVGAIRAKLDQNGLIDTGILSYAVKYCSSFYGPFRDAAEGAPQFGDRKAYQMNPANSQEALREAELDIAEGADIIMVKPALSYLDIIYRIKQKFPQVPLCAYQVSGEYALLKLAAQQGLIDEHQAVTENLLSIKRAGADLIISYFAKDIALALRGA